jgi:hypothetical protein
VISLSKSLILKIHRCFWVYLALIPILAAQIKL